MCGAVCVGVGVAAVAAVAGGGGAEGAFAAVAGLERGDGDAWAGGGGEVVGAGEGWREEDGEAVFEEFGGVAEESGRVVGEGVADGVGVGVAFEPGDDGGGELADVVLGERELGCVAAEVAEQRGGGAVQFGGEFAGLGERRGRLPGRGGRRDERDEGGVILRVGCGCLLLLLLYVGERGCLRCRRPFRCGGSGA